MTPWSVRVRFVKAIYPVTSLAAVRYTLCKSVILSPSIMRQSWCIVGFDPALNLINFAVRFSSFPVTLRPDFWVMAVPYGAWRSRSLDTPQSLWLLWTCDQPDAETSPWQHTTHNRQTSVPSAGFEPTVPANERPQTHVLDCAATGIGLAVRMLYLNVPVSERYQELTTWHLVRSKYGL